eukprot:869729-Rhodomonas_salina.1
MCSQPRMHSARSHQEQAQATTRRPDAGRPRVKEGKLCMEERRGSASSTSARQDLDVQVCIEVGHSLELLVLARSVVQGLLHLDVLVSLPITASPERALSDFQQDRGNCRRAADP